MEASPLSLPAAFRQPCRPGRTVAALMMSDFLMLLVAAGLAVVLRALDTEAWVPWLYYVRMLPVLLVFIVLFAMIELYPGVGLYPGLAVGAVEELRRLSAGITLVYLAAGAASFLARGNTAVYSRGIFLMAWMMSLVLVPIGRSWCRALLGKCRWWGQGVVIFGAGEAGRMVVKALGKHPELGLRPLAVLDDAPEQQPAIPGDFLRGPTTLAPLLATQGGIRYAIVAMPGLPREQLLPLIEQYSRHFPHLLMIPDLFGMASLWVSAKDLGGVLGLELREHLALPGPRRVKRVMDLGLTLVGGLVILPFLLLLAILIKLDSRGPVFFRQERMGQNATRFKAIKFRTMYQDAEARLAGLLASDPKLRQEYETYHKMRHDPRVTRIGRVLRKFSLDEFPQLLNVLKGEMSLVGPRAYLLSEYPLMGTTDKVILRALPGISGLWQVSGRSELSFTERLALDLYYVRNWSPWFDIHLLARTIWVVLFAKGAY